MHCAAQHAGPPADVFAKQILFLAYLVCTGLRSTLDHRQDVFAGAEVDYRGEDVSPLSLLRVLTGAHITLLATCCAALLCATHKRAHHASRNVLCRSATRNSHARASSSLAMCCAALLRATPFPCSTLQQQSRAAITFHIAKQRPQQNDLPSLVQGAIPHGSQSQGASRAMQIQMCWCVHTLAADRCSAAVGTESQTCRHLSTCSNILPHHTSGRQLPPSYPMHVRVLRQIYLTGHGGNGFFKFHDSSELLSKVGSI